MPQSLLAQGTIAPRNVLPDMASSTTAPVGPHTREGPYADQPSPPGRTGLVLLLHVFLVLINIAIFIAGLYELERGVSVPLKNVRQTIHS